MSPGNNRPNHPAAQAAAGAHILTPGQMRVARTITDAYAQPFHFQLQTGPSQVEQQISYGMTKTEYAASLIAGQIAGEYAAGAMGCPPSPYEQRSVNPQLDDAEYAAGVARLAADLASAVLAECHRRLEAPTNAGHDGPPANHQDSGGEKRRTESEGPLAA